MFELYSEDTEAQQILLGELPTELNISFAEHTYSLVGAVNSVAKNTNKTVHRFRYRTLHCHMSSKKQ